MSKPESINKEKIIMKGGVVAIIVNLLLAIFKIIIGAVSHSIAIFSDAIHGLIDSLSGIVLIITGKLAASKKHVSSRAKIERTATIIIAIIIIGVGIHILIESIAKIITPEEVNYSLPVITILVVSVAVKLLLGLYLKKQGRAVNSDALIASGVETLNDAIISVAVLLAALIYLIWHIDIEAYVSLVISFIIIKLGLDFLLKPATNPDSPK